jgi:hypothetical protein
VQDKVWVHGPGAMTVASPAQGSYNLVRAHRNAPGPSASWRAWSGGSVVGAVMGVSSFAWNVITDLRRSGGRVSTRRGCEPGRAEQRLRRRAPAHARSVGGAGRHVGRVTGRAQTASWHLTPGAGYGPPHRCRPRDPARRQ